MLAGIERHQGEVMNSRPRPVATAMLPNKILPVLVMGGVDSSPTLGSAELLAQLRLDFLKMRSCAMGRIFQLVARMKSSMGKRPSRPVSRMVVLASVRNLSARHSWK